MNKNILKAEETILDNKELRNELVDREDVLYKVKDLLLMPGLDLVTSQYVAEFYEVDIKAIRKIMERHKDELQLDGLTKMNKNEAIAKFDDIRRSGVSLRVDPSFVGILVNGYEFKITARAMWVFPKRAILRIGMLLRDSKVAKEIRTQLLNIEEMVAPEIKVQAVDDELSLMKNALIDSYLDDNFDKYSEAMIELSKYKNRHKDEVIDKLKTENLQLKEAYDALERKTVMLTDEATYIPDHEVFREIFVSMMCRLRKKRRFTSEYLCYKEVYSILRSRHGIDLTARYYDAGRSAAKLEYIKDTEWPIVIKLGLSLCYRFHVDIADLIPRLEEKMELK